MIILTHNQLIFGFSQEQKPPELESRKGGGISKSKVWTTALQWFTCVRPKAFSLSVNARAQGIYMESNSSFEELLRRVGSGAYLLGGVDAASPSCP